MISLAFTVTNVTNNVSVKDLAMERLCGFTLFTDTLLHTPHHASCTHFALIKSSRCDDENQFLTLGNRNV